MPEHSQKPLALVVDDDLSYRVYVRQVLELAGFTVLLEANGRQALRRLSEAQVSVLVTDLSMPEMDGLELIEIVKRRFPGIRIVAISGGGPHGDSSNLRLAAIFGAHATFHKPFSGSELIAAVPPDTVKRTPSSGTD